MLNWFWKRLGWTRLSFGDGGQVRELWYTGPEFEMRRYTDWIRNGNPGESYASYSRMVVRVKKRNWL